VRAMEERWVLTARAVRVKAREMKNEANEVHLEAVVEEVVGGAPAVVVAVDAATRDVSTDVVVEVVALGPKVAGVVNNPVTATRKTTELMKAQHENMKNINKNIEKPPPIKKRTALLLEQQKSVTPTYTT